jgi:hypothetical protein
MDDAKYELWRIKISKNIGKHTVESSSKKIKYVPTGGCYRATEK